MKKLYLIIILKQLNKFFIILFITSFFVKLGNSNEPVDIWSIDKNDNVIEETLIENNQSIKNENPKKIKIIDQNKNIIIDNSIDSNNIKLAGLYDPAENGLSIDMWSNSNGKDIKYFLDKLSSKKLSKFSEKILDVALLTNSYLPTNNISSEEFLDFKFQYLINKKDFNLIKNFIIKNPSVEDNHKIIRFYIDYY